MSTVPPTPAGVAPDDPMSPYERAAWASLIASASAPDRIKRSLVPARARAAGARAAQAVGDRWDQVPGSENFEAVLVKSLRALQRSTTDLAMRTVNVDRVIASYRSEFESVQKLDDVRALDLRECDRRMPRRRTGYGLAAAAAGAGTSLAITGTVVSATVTGGTTAAVAIGALATDVTGTLASLGRIIAVTAAQYGYDVREPEEEIFAAGVLSYAMAGTGGSKVAAMTSVSRLTQQMMRRATFEQLRKHQLVNIIDRVYLALGVRLTHQKLAQAVPIAGAVINGGLNVELVDRTFRRAAETYRLRFLAEKYGLDLAGALPVSSDATAEAPDDLAVDEMIDEAVAEVSGNEIAVGLPPARSTETQG